MTEKLTDFADRGEGVFSPLRIPSRMITVITATYNAADSLPNLIRYLREQTFRDFEWIVADGGSTDGTLDLLRCSSDVVSQWTSEPDFGIYDALNRALSVASGSYYLVLGADDCLFPRAIEWYSNAAEHGVADVISAHVKVGGVVVTPRRVVRWHSGPPLVSAHSVGSLIRRSLHDELGFYSRRFPLAADTYFLLRAWRAGKKFGELPKVVGEFSTHGISSTDLLGALTESFRANVEVRGNLDLQTLLFLMRIIKNRRRLVRGLRRGGGFDERHDD